MTYLRVIVGIWAIVSLVGCLEIAAAYREDWRDQIRQTAIAFALTFSLPMLLVFCILYRIALRHHKHLGGFGRLLVEYEIQTQTGDMKRARDIT